MKKAYSRDTPSVYGKYKVKDLLITCIRINYRPINNLSIGTPTRLLGFSMLRLNKRFTRTRRTETLRVRKRRNGGRSNVRVTTRSGYVNKNENERNEKIDVNAARKTHACARGETKR